MNGRQSLKISVRTSYRHYLLVGAVGLGHQASRLSLSVLTFLCNFFSPWHAYGMRLGLICSSANKWVVPRPSFFLLFC